MYKSGLTVSRLKSYGRSLMETNLMVEMSEGKKFINDPYECVTESLYGFVRANPHVRLLEGYNTVVRSDVDDLIKAKKVCLVTGGGSGHEPSHIGYIGKGMLTASVCGNVFASPPASSIYAAITECASPAGVLLIVTNYTGDRLNFGKAAELAKHNGVKVDMIIVGEDCALTSKDKGAGRRGLCGTMFIHKIAGAMAENGQSLEQIKSFTEKTVRDMGTISISLSPCSIPGQAPTFQVGDGEAEFGLGIHGEPGVKRIKMTSAKTFVSEMIEHIENSKYIPKLADGSLAVFVNSLGGTSQLELSLMAGEIFKNLESRGCNVTRCYVGSLMTSLEMAGISVTLLHVKDDTIKLLDQETIAPAWPKQGETGKSENVTRALKRTKLTSESSVTISEHDMSELGKVLFRCTSRICDILISNEESLNAYDRKAGDGDCGTTFARGAKALLDQLGTLAESKMPLNDTDKFFLAIASIAESSMGGSSGALVSLFLTAASVSLKNDSSAKTFVSAIRQGSEAVVRYGGAEEGDRTMLDALFPLLRALEKEVAEGNNDPSKLATVACKAALDGTTNTVSMTAKAGRASYVSSSHFTDPDPGAMAVSLIFDALASALHDKS